MPLPVAPNTTVDIYHAPNAPPADPNVPAVPCHLTPCFAKGNEAGTVGGHKYTHLMLVDAGIDVRDQYSSDAALGEVVYVPDKNGTPFAVKMVTLAGRGGPHEHQRVWLARKEP